MQNVMSEHHAAIDVLTWVWKAELHETIKEMLKIMKNS